MKTIILILTCSLLVFGCDNAQVKRLKSLCSNLGLDKKSNEFKECIKSYDHLFVFSLEKNIASEQEEINKHNKYAEAVNAVDLNIDERKYEEVDFPKFIEKSFLDSLLLSDLKDKYALKKRIKFKSDFSINFDENNKIDMTLSADDPKDYYNSLFLISNAGFQNIEIQKKIMQKSSVMRFFPLSFPPTKKESLIFGYFDEVPGEFLKKYKFYVEDVKMKKVYLSDKEIKEYLMFNYVNQNKSEKRSAAQIIADLTILINKLNK